MRSLRWCLGAWVVLLLAGSAAARGTYNCLPTCDSTDARFLAISGSNLVNLSTTRLDLTISVPAGTTSFRLGFFDGDANGLDASGISHWDTGVTAIYQYTLFADPRGDGLGSEVVEMTPGFPSVLSTAMPDNAWIDYQVTTGGNARAPSGNYFYRLRIQLLDSLVTTTNGFKVRTDAQVSGTTIDPIEQPFSYIANLRGVADLQIVYPAFPSATPTRYDGTFDFYFDIPVSQQDLVLWDGDFDRGRFDGTDLDTDDPDTPGAPFLPSWATPSAVPEGVATGVAGTTGNPPDDRNPAGAGIYNSKPPSVEYQVTFPDGQTFLNGNPSGNSEWEQFRISTAPFDRSQMDYHADSIPPGTYLFHGLGIDMQNLNALLLPSRVLCVGESGVPCRPLRPYLLGDTVFADPNGNGVQDPGEPGIPGVVLQLSDGLGYPLGTAVTDASGHYSFEVDAYPYTVKVTTPPAGYLATTSTQCQATIRTDNVLTCDFGYRVPLSLGDRIWNDANANGLQDAGEAGINGVTVQLLNAGGTVVATTVTSGNGNYLFGNLLPGTYTARVVAATLPGGSTPTADLDGTATANQATVSLTASRSDVDFGYHVRSATAGGTGTLGYWKNHASAWPVSSITIGGVTYTKAQAIQWLGTPPRGDVTISLFHQLVSAELNALTGNDASCITATIQAADAWLTQYPLGSGVSSSSPAGQTANALQDRLDAYNNGRLCAPHRD